MDAKIILEQFQDFLAPLLDTYEEAIYFPVFVSSLRVERRADASDRNGFVLWLSG